MPERDRETITPDVINVEYDAPDRSRDRDRLRDSSNRDSGGRDSGGRSRGGRENARSREARTNTATAKVNDKSYKVSEKAATAKKQLETELKVMDIVEIFGGPPLEKVVKDKTRDFINGELLDAKLRNNRGDAEMWGDMLDGMRKVNILDPPTADDPVLVFERKLADQEALRRKEKKEQEKKQREKDGKAGRER